MEKRGNMANGITYDIDKNNLDIEDARYRLYKSSSDKIYKSLRPIIKKYVLTKINQSNPNRLKNM